MNPIASAKMSDATTIPGVSVKENAISANVWKLVVDIDSACITDAQIKPTMPPTRPSSSASRRSWHRRPPRRPHPRQLPRLAPAEALPAARRPALVAGARAVALVPP